MSSPITGLWFVGARGAVATTTTVGLLAARRGVPLRGVTTAGPRGEGLGLPDPRDLVVGGWEIRPGRLVRSATELAEARVFDPRLPEGLADELDAVDREIVTGGTRGVSLLGGAPGPGESASHVVARLRDDLRRFRDRHRVERIVVVNVATTEPAFTPLDEHLSLAAFETSLRDGRPLELRPSTLYAYASILEGAAFVNFAASPAALVPALRELAEERRVPFAGTDGKTGETLVKSALACLFRERDLRVLAWHGSNLLGNSDGAALAEPEVAAAKVRTKDSVVRSILGYAPQTSVDIRYVPTLGDWKTAWDLVQFEGFLGTRMTLQFTWQGSDSILAAPLILDLVRLADLALRRGEAGPMTHTACFFKSPVGTQEHDLSRQYAILDHYLNRCRMALVARAGSSRRGGVSE